MKANIIIIIIIIITITITSISTLELGHWLTS
jgi:hypothetical protein